MGQAASTHLEIQLSNFQHYAQNKSRTTTPMHMRAWFFPFLSLVIATPAAAQKDPSEKPAVYDGLTPPAPATPRNAKVDGLGADLFRTLQSIRENNPSATTLTEADANQVKTVILADGKVDEVERDLLDELVSAFIPAHGITITAAGSKPDDPKLKLYPVSQNAKRVLISLLVLDLPAAWAKGKEGWPAMIDEYRKNPQHETRVLDFVRTMLAAEWAKSNQSNGYKPLRDLLARHYGFVQTQEKEKAHVGKRILHEAMRKVDVDEGGKVPDYMYTWLLN